MLVYRYFLPFLQVPEGKNSRDSSERFGVHLPQVSTALKQQSDKETRRAEAFLPARRLASSWTLVNCLVLSMLFTSRVQQ